MNTYKAKHIPKVQIAKNAGINHTGSEQVGKCAAVKSRVYPGSRHRHDCLPLFGSTSQIEDDEKHKDAFTPQENGIDILMASLCSIVLPKPLSHTLNIYKWIVNLRINIDHGEFKADLTVQ
jgi:hypothetical protein